MGGLSPGEFRREVVVRQYVPNARSPLVHLAVAIVAFVVALGTVRWHLDGGGSEGDGGPSSYLWGLAQGLAYGADGPVRVEDGGSGGWWALAAMAVTTIAIVVWLSRLGANARFGQGNFGPALALLALPSWWALAALVDNNGVYRDFDESRTRAVLLLVLLVGQAIGVRWLFTHRLWNSGHLPRPEVSFLLWVPNLVASFLVWGAVAFTYVSEEPGSGDESAWLPTETSVRAALWTSRLTAAAVVVVAVVVTIRQHQGIARERAEHEASAAELRSGLAPVPGPGPSAPLMGAPSA